jgi:integrase
MERVRLYPQHLDHRRRQNQEARRAPRTAHRVPLSRQVLAILEEMREITGKGRYLFPAQGKRDRPMCENTINLSLRRMGFDCTIMTALISWRFPHQGRPRRAA